MLEELSQFREELSQCRHCLNGSDYLPCLPGTAPNHNLRPPLLVLAESPTPEESELQSPWSSHQHQFVRQLLREAGIGVQFCWFSYLIRCPKPVGIASHCQSWLDRELRVVQPRVVLALGKTCFQALVGKKLSYRDHLYQLIPQPGSERMIAVVDHSTSLFSCGRLRLRRVAHLLTQIQGLL